jgi:hypothetical protein
MKLRIIIWLLVLENIFAWEGEEQEARQRLALLSSTMELLTTNLPTAASDDTTAIRILNPGEKSSSLFDWISTLSYTGQ